MCSSAASSYLWYNPPLVNNRCGEVFCSQTFDEFLINCTNCTQEFNLLSCSLFIKHVKECARAIASGSGLGNQSPGQQGAPNYTIDNLLKDALKNNNIDDVPRTENNIDPLMVVKVEKVEVPDEQMMDDVDYQEEDDITIDKVDRLKKIEELSDYQEEDDLTIDKVARRKKIEELIKEYKKHPALWEFNQKRSTLTEAIKKQDYKQIRKNINSKLKTNFTEKELRAEINNLRSTYKRVLESKENGIVHENKLLGKLWYFNKISFIGANSSDIQIEPEEDEISEQDGGWMDAESSNSVEVRLKPKLEKTKDKPNPKISFESTMISDIIAQYKEHTFLWDKNAALYNNKSARTIALSKITNFINKKFCKQFTEKDLGQQIKNLRRAYRRVQSQKDKGVNLWYFHKLSFIDSTSDKAEVLPIPEIKTAKVNEGTIKVRNLFDEQKPLNLDEPLEMPHLKSDKDDDNGDDTVNEGTTDDMSCPNILSLIEEYKRYPCLWDTESYRTSSRFQRNDANKSITKAINYKYKTNFTDNEIQKKIFQLRSSYKRVLRTKEAYEKKHANENKKFKPRLWYFDKMSFIDTKEKEIENDKDQGEAEETENANNEKEQEEAEETENAMYNENDDDSNLDADFLPEDNSDTSDEEPSDEENESKSSAKTTPTTKNRELLTALIKEYKKLPVLWAVKPYTNDDYARKSAYMELADIINAKFNTQFTRKSISKEVNKLRCSYNRMLRQKQLSQNGELKRKLWYADLLSFIEKKPKNMEDENQDSIICLDMDPPGDSAFDKNYNSDGDEPSEKKQKLDKGEHVFEIIELLKAAPMLWDTRHHQYNQRAVRKRAIEKIITTLSREHNCHLTNTEFRFQMRFFRDSYFRALQQEMGSEGNIKLVKRPFFFDQMSFLKPLAETNSKKSIKAEASTEDFVYLTKNKQLMNAFIELYKAQRCLWDPEHKDHNNQSACLQAYNEIGNMFEMNNINLTKERLTSAVSFLHTIGENTQKPFKFEDPKEPIDPAILFYEQLQFLVGLPQVKDIYCNHCDQYFRKVADYEKHNIEYLGDRPYKCFICNAEFASRFIFAYHQMTHKTAHKCDICGFQAFDNCNFEIHMRRHKGIYSYKCEHCDKGFVTSTEYNRHVRLHSNERPFICHICGKALATNSELEEHMKRHLNQRDYKCEICGSAFFTTKTLKGHMASHSTERQHVCEICGGAFKRRKTLLQHKALHAEHKRYDCKICGKLFAQKTGLNYHMKSHGSRVGS